MGIEDEKPSANPGRTPDDEIEGRIVVTVALLAQGVRKSQIKRILASKFSVSARTCENYLARAREQLLEEVREERDEQRSLSLALYRSIISNPNSTMKDKILAQQRIDRLLGLEAPIKWASTTTDGQDVVPAAAPMDLRSLTTEELIALRDVRKKLSSASVSPSIN